MERGFEVEPVTLPRGAHAAGAEADGQRRDRILILGAGAGGLRVALGLDRLLLGHRACPVLLVDQHDYHTLQPRLPAVAGGAVRPPDATLPLRRLLSGRRVETLRATVRQLDPAARRVVVDGAELTYRWLVLALGGEPATHSLPGVAEHALSLKSVADAIRLREAVGQSFRQAAWKLDPAERAALATVVVAGAGYTGVELAAALAERVRYLALSFRLPADVGRVVLVERAERVLPEHGRELAAAVHDVLERLGVAVRPGAGVAAAERGLVRLTTGEELRCGVFVWAGGVAATGVVRAAGLPTGSGGRLLVSRELRSLARPEVFALGDGCLVLDEGVNPEPQSAQRAVRQGDVVAHNVYAEVAGGGALAGGGDVPLRQYRAAPQDVVLGLGRQEAVAQVRGVVLSGWRAVVARRLAELRYLEAIGGPGALLTELASALPRVG